MSMSGEKRDHQNFFFLSSIQISSLGLATISIGNLLATRYGAGTVFSSIIVGNLILWLIGISVISMSHQTNSIQTIKSYIGDISTFLIVGIFVISAMDWFAFGINSSVNSLQGFVSIGESFPKNIFLRIGTALGVFTSLLALGGIRLLKWVSVVTFPFLVIYFIYQLLSSDLSIPPLQWGLSLSAVITVMFSFLIGILNLPTFFRHSSSRADSYLALTLFTLFYIFFECAGMWINFKDPSSGILMGIPSNSWIQNQFVIVFVVLTCICNNLMNIYFVSACYETYSPKFSGMKGHAIMGLLGTATYAFVQISPPIAFMLELFSIYMLNLAVVLLVAFLLRLLIKRATSDFERRINSVAWIVGCVAGTISRLQNPQEEFKFVFVAIGSSVLFFLILVFVEETTRAVRDFRLRKVVK